MVKVKSKKYELFLLIALILSSGTLFFTWYLHWYEKIPSEIRIKAGVEQILDLEVPATGHIYKKAESVDNTNALYVNFGKAVTVKADSLQSYQADLKLFGIFPLKSVNIDVIEDRELIPAGIPIGIYVETEGVLVIGVGEFENRQGMEVSPAKYLLQEGDYILEINGSSIDSKKELVKSVSLCEGNSLTMKIERQGENFDIKIEPAMDQNGEYKLGIWIRDNAQGVGTLTFVNKSQGFGALGHGINDVDTGELLKIEAGSLYLTDIIAIQRGLNGEPGQMTGVIDYSGNRRIGEIYTNSEKGIYGVVGEKLISGLEEESLPICLKQDVKQGAAQIISTVGDSTDYYDIEIEEIYLDNTNVNRGILLHVTDEELLAKTGGIIQGMSGSPIIQDGKIIGAVTHVLVDDPTRGYGIFIEEMLELN